MHRECRERFPRHPLQSKSLVVRHARTVMHVGIANPRWQGKHSRRMRNSQFYVSGKKPKAQIAPTSFQTSTQKTGKANYRYPKVKEVVGVENTPGPPMQNIPLGIYHNEI